MDPLRRNADAIKLFDELRASGKLLDKTELVNLSFPSYYGWVTVGPYDVYMYLHGKDDGVAYRWLWRNHYESPSLHVWSRLCRHFSLAIDVGAYSGVYSLVAAKTNPKASILSIEPLPLNIARLTLNANYNALKNIRVIPGAAYSSASKLSMNNYPNMSYLISGLTVSPVQTQSLNSKQESSIVDAFTLDSLVKREHFKALVKIDAEGCEGEVLSGSTELLKARSFFLIESTDSSTANHLDRIFYAHKYAFYIIDNNKANLIKADGCQPIYDKSGKLDPSLLNRLVIPREADASFLKLLS